MAYSFTDILSQAQRRGQLTGRKVTASDQQGIASGYFQTALERTLAARKLALQEQALKDSQSNFADELALRKADMEAQQDAAKKATTQGYVNTGVQTVGTGALLKGIYGKNTANPTDAGTLTNESLYTGANAADKTALIGNEISNVNAANNIYAPAGTTTAAATGQGTSQVGSLFGSQTAAENQMIGSGIVEAQGGNVAANQTIGQGINAANAAEGTASGGGATLSGIAAPIAYIAAAEAGRLYGGGQGKSFEEKNRWQRAADSPATAGMMTSIMPGSTWARADSPQGNAYKGMSALNRTAMAPIDYVFGDRDAFNGERLKDIGEAGSQLVKDLGNIDTYINPFGEEPFGDSSTGETLYKILNPVSAIGKGCIIVTACTSPDSPEVNLTREYRDKFMDADQLRGYYMIAEKVVPKIEKSPKLKYLVRRYLVDNLIEYGAFALGKANQTSLRAELVAKAFLGLCRMVGRTRKQFVRANGEVY